MSKVHIDIETFSPEPIADTGGYKYAMHHDFEILLDGEICVCESLCFYAL